MPVTSRIEAAGSAAELEHVLLAWIARQERRASLRRAAFWLCAAIATFAGAAWTLADRELAIPVLVVAGVATWSLRPRTAAGFKRAAGLRTLLAMLDPELAAGESLRLRCDLRHPLSAPAQPLSTAAGRGKRSRESFDDAWMAVEARLANGIAVVARHGITCVRTTVTRSKSRGRTAKKTKYKVRTSMELRVTFPLKRYAATARSLPLEGATCEVREEGGRLRVRACLDRRLPASPDVPDFESCDAPADWLRFAEWTFRHARPLEPESRR